ncbi:cytochrome c-type biogenesis protein [Yunchengibacter salinarum]|uniref:cytochrome c-type biogenesis protein n=1 Tax=Yunchengibacter salinarum TaxID=3133399 RepID=UPI0035B6836C
MRLWLAAFMLCLTMGALILAAPATNPVWAVAVDEQQLADPRAEARARALMQEIRCLVCQNQSIVDSDADLARDLRALVREQVAAGKSNQAIKNYLVARYGDWVLLEPPLDARTLLLWGSPVLFLALAGLAVWLGRRKRPAPALSAEEEAAADALLAAANTDAPPHEGSRANGDDRA